MSEDPKEKEIRRLLSRAWSRRRPKLASPSVHNAGRMDLNSEFKEPRGEGIKIFLMVVTLFALLILAASQLIGMEWD